MRTTLFCLAFCISLAATAQINITYQESPRQLTPPMNNNEVLKRFSSIIAATTISCDDSCKTNYGPYLQLINFLQDHYPLLHQQLDRKIINNYSLLYKWEGTDTSLSPNLLISHYDVVPVEQHAMHKWLCEPFAGVVDTAFIWGRGTIDAKFQLAAILEATETLLAENYKPERTIYFAFGHDEETGGRNGAARISQYLQDQHLTFNMILDEGGGIADGIFPGVVEPIAFIGTSEKGFMNIELSVEEAGGHSSAPPRETPITILSNGIAKLNSSPMKSKMNHATEEMLVTVKPYMDRKSRFAMNHQKLFRKRILRQLAANPASDALIRTSISPTMIQGGVKENSLPSFASANLNVRSLPEDSPDEIRAHIITTLGDARIKVKIQPGTKSSISETRTSSAAYQNLKHIIQLHFPGTIVAPVICIATTDSHHYAAMSSNILRFTPAVINDAEKHMMHGENERISIRNYLQSIRFYHDLIKASDPHHPG